jgi:hypothetical protein
MIMYIDIYTCIYVYIYYVMVIYDVRYKTDWIQVWGANPHLTNPDDVGEREGGGGGGLMNE